MKWCREGGSFRAARVSKRSIRSTLCDGSLGETRRNSLGGLSRSIERFHKLERPHRLPTRAALMAAACLGTFAAQAQLPDWVRFVESNSPLRNVFFQTVSLPSGPIAVERAPAQTHTALTLLLQAGARGCRSLCTAGARVRAAARLRCGRERLARVCNTRLRPGRRAACAG